MRFKQPEPPRLTDEDCESFGRYPGAFYDMLRAVYAYGFNAGYQQAKTEPIERKEK